MHVLLFFIDGFGLGSNNPKDNPMVNASTPGFDMLLQSSEGFLIPTDATQGIPGLPQSATGQAAILTGIKAAKILGRHISGFPGPRLREIISKNNIFKELRALGRKVTFANAYTPDYLKSFLAGEIGGSVTTVTTHSAGLPFRRVEQIVTGQAVYQEFTNRILQDRGLEIPLFSPERAAGNLINIVSSHDFTLYEFFQTDIYGHRQDMQAAVKLLECLDRFTSYLLNHLHLPDTLLVITSDHGNIEDLSVKTHTKNPVPTYLIGQGAEQIKDKISDISDIAPAIISLIK